MSQQKVLLTPETVTATYDTATHQLTIEASGREDGVQQIKIEEVHMFIQTPVFMITGEISAAIGNFPYTTKGQFSFLQNPQNITIRTTQGDKTYPVTIKNTANASSAPAQENARCGLFLAHYLLTNGLIGGPVFNIYLTVNTATGAVHGDGNITQATNPPVNIGTKLDGNFTYMTVMPNKTSILVTATGYPCIHWSPNLGIGPVLLPNADLRMVLSADWKSGTANYKYMDTSGHWVSMTAKAQLCGTSAELEESQTQELA